MVDYEKLGKFTGEWVLVLKDEVVNHSDNVEEILRDAEKYPDEEVTLCKVPPKNFSNML